MNTVYPISASDPVVLVAITLAGFFTWVILNRLSIRGDHASLFYAAALTSLYVAARQSGQTVETPFLFCSIVTSTYACSALLSTVFYRLSPFHPLAGYSGPISWRISSLWLSYVSSTGRRHLIVDDLHKRHGPFVRIGPNTLSINAPFGHLIYGAGHSMDKSDAYTTPGHLKAVALFFKQKDKALHGNRKRIWSGAFTGSSVASFFSPLEKRTWQLLKCIEGRKGEDGTVNLSECICHWSYDFMGEMVFGGSNNLELMRDGDPEGLVEGLKQATIVLDSLGQTPWLMDIIWHLPFGKAMHRIRHRAAAMMRTRIKADKDVDMRDLASHLLAGDPQTGEQLSQADLDLDATVAIQGGSDNTSTTLSLAFYFLLSQPRYYHSLQVELAQAFPDPTGYLDASKLTSLTLLNAVISETLRLGSPFFLPRVVPPTGVTVGGRAIPPATIVALAAYSQQTSTENYYPNPMDFLPERWIPGGLGVDCKTEKSVLASFSYGTHGCVAKSFAYQELRFVLARLILTLEMSLPTSFDVAAFREGILNMRTTVFAKPLMVKTTRRKGVEIDTFL